jgi:protein-tyrosine-phosphatase
MTLVLFVCTANRYRSPIAAACFNNVLIKRRNEPDWSIMSAGTWTVDGLPPIPEAIHEAKELGLDISEHRSQTITKQLIQQADLIITMEQGQREALQNEFRDGAGKISLLSEVVEGITYDIIDPVKDSTNTDVASKICELIHTGFENIYNEAMASRSTR